jgi:ribosomal protein S18 acetylase RimI-like enzyme
MIRKLDINDIDSYCNLRVAMLLSDKSVSYNKEELVLQTREYYEDYINKTLFIFGYIENEEIVSVAAYEVLKRLPTPKINNLNSDIAYVCSIYTKEEYRNKGYSKLLLNEVIEDAKKRGLTRFKLSSHNEIAIKLYKKFGFKSDLTAMVKND